MAVLFLLPARIDAQRQDNLLNPRYEKLVNLLGDDSFLVRERATQELIQLGLTARVAVTAALDNPDVEIRSRGWRIYKTWTTEEKVKLLADDSLMVRQGATDALIRLGPAERAEMTTALDGVVAESRSRVQRIYEECRLTEYLLKNPNEIDFLNPKQAAEIVSRYPEQLSLPNLTFFLKERAVARELAKHKEDLALDGLKSMDRGVAQELAKLTAGRLNLQALEFMDKNVAQELAKLKGTLQMFCLKSMDKDVARPLAKYSGTKTSFGTSLEVSDEDILEVLRSNPRIELPQNYRDLQKTSQQP